MKIKHFAMTGVIALAAFGAQATTVGPITVVVDDTLGATPFLLDPTNTAGGILTTTTIDGYAVAPGLNVAGNFFLAGEPDGSGGSAVVTLVPNVNFLSFDWATPDDFNTLVIKLSDNSTDTITASALGLATGLDRYVNFSVGGGLFISSLTFESTSPAFEAGNFSVNVVPEPGNMALLLAGLGVMGVMARRRA